MDYFFIWKLFFFFSPTWGKVKRNITGNLLGLIMDQIDVSCKSTVYNPSLPALEATNSGNSQPPNNFHILRTFARAKYKPQETLTCCHSYLETSTISPADSCCSFSTAEAGLQYSRKPPKS